MWVPPVPRYTTITPLKKIIMWRIYENCQSKERRNHAKENSLYSVLVKYPHLIIKIKHNKFLLSLDVCFASNVKLHTPTHTQNLSFNSQYLMMLHYNDNIFKFFSYQRFYLFKLVLYIVLCCCCCFYFIIVHKRAL